jgi:hypothetical protein
MHYTKGKPLDTAELSYAERAIVALLKCDVVVYPVLQQYIDKILAGEHLKRPRVGRPTVELDQATIEQLLVSAA